MKGSNNPFPSVLMAHTSNSTIGDPAVYHTRLLTDDDGTLKMKDSSGTVSTVGMSTDMTTHENAADPHSGYVLESLMDAVGDIFVADGDDSVAKLGLGASNTVLGSSNSTLAYVPVSDSSFAPDSINAAAAPSVTDDFTKGWRRGSRWIDTTHDKEYICLDETTGAAVWTETTQSAVGGDITSDTAWAAKGDLIVADADDSAQVLSVGTNDQVLTADSGEATGMKWAAAGSGLTTGTSFPGSPSTGDRYRRTDLDYAIYFYDGTRWLSEVEYSLSTFVLNTWEPTSSHYAYLPVPQDADIYVERFDAWGWLSASGDWDVSITCKTAASAATWTSSVATFDDSSVRPSITTTIGQVCSGSSGSDAYLQVRIEEQSGSANFKNSVTIYFRRIAT